MDLVWTKTPIDGGLCGVDLEVPEYNPCMTEHGDLCSCLWKATTRVTDSETSFYNHTWMSIEERMSTVGEPEY